ncbi:hypothetical protein BJ165DRAFT_1519184 [Panaeolus papilionaceus]|nr:hypothetical protein BJ165DRAFT_1519184 [Panaeolus papilionaceus]
MSNTTKEYENLGIKGPLSVVPVTPEDVKGQDIFVYLLMGPTGAGKSAFIESLSPNRKLEISKDSLESVTQEVVCYRVANLTHDHWGVVLLDTPGFLDAMLSESRITRRITDTLNKLSQVTVAFVVCILYFQPITDIRLGRSKRDAVKLLKAFAESFKATAIAVVTTMWNQISTPKQIEDANSRFSSLQNEIYVDSVRGLGIRVTKFEFSSDSALSTLDAYPGGWSHDEDKPQTMGPQYQSLIHNSLLERIANAQQQLHMLAADKQNACTPGREDPLLLAVVLRDEKTVLAALQSFVDDLVASGLTGLTVLESLLDASYNANTSACSSPWSRTILPSNVSTLEPEELLISDRISLTFASPILSDVQNQSQEPSSSHIVYPSLPPRFLVSTSFQRQLTPSPSPSPSHNALKSRLKDAIAPLKGVFKNVKK